jgi:riboflavin synthase
MFTGIIETLGTVKEVISSHSGRSFWIESSITPELQVDQSLSHDGVCMTIEEILDKNYRITAVKETLKKTNLGLWQPGYQINLERSLTLNDRIDGHLVQGHVDTTGILLKKKLKDENGEFTFGYPGKHARFAFNVKKKSFTVAIIPYTFKNTNIANLQKGDPVNLEFDLIGKYILKSLPNNR